MHKFWNFACDNETQTRTLTINGVIAEEAWFDNEVAPKEFRDELNAGQGDITVVINSPGGDFFAGTEIYNMLLDYPGKVTVKIDALAASAASIIAMAGDSIIMSPVSMIMIHNPATLAYGQADDMQKAIDMLNAVKESIINAYMQKTHLTHDQLAEMMSNETWLDANKAKELGFCDQIVDRENKPDDTITNKTGYLFSVKNYNQSVINKVTCKYKPQLTKSDAYRRLLLSQKSF